jgi:repressor LexA
MKLTRRQKEILDFITAFIEREGYSPSMEEIAEYFHFASLNAVFKHLQALESRGHLRRDPNRARAIEVSAPRASAVRGVPLLGNIAAGRPLEAIENQGTIAVPEEFLPRRGSYYVLRVQGESMIEDHIQDDDFVIVESRDEALDGEMVVALVDGENVTLKKLHREGTHVRLQPANPAVAPLILESSRVKVQGIVVGVMRKYR